MRASLLLPFAAATAGAFDYSSYQNKYGHSSGANSTHEASGSQYEGSSGNWTKYQGAAGDWKKYSNWHKYWNGSKSESSSSMDGGNESSDTFSGPFHSDESILKLKGNLTALKAKEKEVEHSVEQVKKFVPKTFQTAPLGQFKKDLSDIHHMIKEAEEAKKAAEEAKKEAEEAKKENETKPSVAANETSDAVVTALLARTKLLTVIDAKVDDIEDKIKAVKKREDDIKKYVPEEYQSHALKAEKSELESLEAALKAAKLKEAEKEAKIAAKALKKEAKEAKTEAEKVKETETKAEKKDEAEEEKEKEEAKKNATSSKPSSAANESRTDSEEAHAISALVASDGPSGTIWGSASLCFCATVSVLSLFVALQQRRPMPTIDQRPLLG